MANLENNIYMEIFEILPQEHNSWRLVYKLEKPLYRYDHN